MDLNSSIKNAQSEFYDWATKWIRDGKIHEKNKTPDVIDLITIFQILGFTISHVDARDPRKMSILSCGERGLKINISCSHSGIRFILEGSNVCSCSQNMIDDVCQIMQNPNAQGRKETYAKIRLPEVPEGEKLVVQTVLSHLVYMIHAATKDDTNQNVIKTNAEDNQQNNAEQAITSIEKEVSKYCPVREIAPISSTTRCKSLEQLTGQTLTNKYRPESGHLNKKEKTREKISVPVITCSSPNLHSPSKPSNISSPVANFALLKQGHSKLLSVQELVKDVIEIFEKTQEIPKFISDISTLKASTESLSVKNPGLTNTKSDTNLVVKKNVRPLCRPSIRSVSSNTGTNTLPNPTTSRRSSENISPTFKTNTAKSQRFAHVKSTIPKGNASKK